MAACSAHVRFRGCSGEMASYAREIRTSAQIQFSGQPRVAKRFRLGRAMHKKTRREAGVVVGARPQARFP